jgi:hypothetical protein
MLAWITDPCAATDDYSRPLANRMLEENDTEQVLSRAKLERAFEKN